MSTGPTGHVFTCVTPFAPPWHPQGRKHQAIAILRTISSRNGTLVCEAALQALLSSAAGAGDEEASAGMAATAETAETAAGEDEESGTCLLKGREDGELVGEAAPPVLLCALKGVDGAEQECWPTAAEAGLLAAAVRERGQQLLLSTLCIHTEVSSTTSSTTFDNKQPFGSMLKNPLRDANFDDDAADDHGPPGVWQALRTQQVLRPFLVLSVALLALVMR